MAPRQWEAGPPAGAEDEACDSDGTSHTAATSPSASARTSDAGSGAEEECEDAPVAKYVPRVKVAETPPEWVTAHLLAIKKGDYNPEIAEQKIAGDCYGHNGNMAWAFGNWGQPSKVPLIKLHAKMVVQRMPGEVVCIAECGPHMADWLKQNSRDAVSAAADDRGKLEDLSAEPTEAMDTLMAQRCGTQEHLVIRSNEACALAIAAKKRSVKRLSLVYHHRSPGLSAGHGTSH